MSDCLASSQPGTGLNKNADAVSSPVPEKEYRILNGGIPMPVALANLNLMSFTLEKIPFVTKNPLFNK